MLVGVIQKPSMAAMAELIETIDTTLYDALELRLDACRDLTLEGLAALALPLPAIFTLRCKEQGGSFEGSEQARLGMLARLMRLSPAYMDLEATIPAGDISLIRAVSPSTRIILSQHDFTGSPKSYSDMLSPMKRVATDVIYKFAARAESTLDALRMLVFCKEQETDVIGISMGEDGATTRILAPVAHAGFCYCPVREASAPGQMDAAMLREVYNFSSLNRRTAIYGLLGDPVDRSIGHVFHNRRNAETGCNAVYVKWRLAKEEMAEAMPLLARLGVRGVSVTMPLKEAAVDCLSTMDDSVRSIGAVNTLKADSQGWAGINTDGQGALAALGAMSPTNKKVVFVGAGGAARAVMHEIARQTDNIVVYNRTVSKKMPVAADVRPLEEISRLRGYDLIINGLPFDTPFSFTRIPFVKGSTAMDLSYGKKSAFLECAANAGCVCIDGSGMFEAQALLQRKYWGLP